MCLVWWLVYSQHISIIPFFDHCHRVWNDTRLARRASGLWTTTLLVTLVTSSAFGPWNQSQFWATVKEGVAQHIVSASEHALLFQSEILTMRRDRGYYINDSDAVIASTLWDEYNDDPCWTCRGDTVKLARWFSFIDMAGRLLRRWRRTYVAHLYCALSMGLVSTIKNETIGIIPVMEKKPAKPAEDGNKTKASTTGSNASVSALRRECNNYFHIACTVLADMNVRNRIAIILTVVEPTRLFHGEVRKKLISPEYCCEWYTSMSQ